MGWSANLKVLLHPCSRRERMGNRVRASSSLAAMRCEEGASVRHLPQHSTGGLNYRSVQTGDAHRHECEESPTIWEHIPQVGSWYCLRRRDNARGSQGCVDGLTAPTVVEMRHFLLWMYFNSLTLCFLGLGTMFGLLH
jgi:hypothetical protein